MTEKVDAFGDREEGGATVVKFGKRYTEEEAAKELGLSKSTLSRLRLNRKIGHSRPSERIIVYYDRHLDAFREKTEVQSCPTVSRSTDTTLHDVQTAIGKSDGPNLEDEQTGIDVDQLANEILKRPRKSSRRTKC